MARQCRIISKTDIYHVILRGVNKQRIFEQPEDYRAIFRILKSVQKTKSDGIPSETPTFFVYSYCMMDNHIHLLMQPNGYEIGQIMKRISTTYAIYFNTAYERTGHLFEQRFKSTPVESRDYFFTLVEYINNNPVRAGICRTPDQYAYSSMSELLSEKKGLLSFYPDYSTASEMDDAERAYRAKRAAGEEAEEPVMMNLCITRDELLGQMYSMPKADTKTRLRLELERFAQGDFLGQNSDQLRSSALCTFLRGVLHTESAEDADNALVQTLLEMTGTKSISEFQQTDKKTMRRALAVVLESGVSKARLSRLTGVPVGVIRYCTGSLK